MKQSILTLVLLLVAITLGVLFRANMNSGVEPMKGLPWQIEILPNGETRVFGLVPARSTLDEARGRFGRDMQIAVIAAPGETGSLEAYASNVSAGVILGKIILAAEMNKENVVRLRRRAIKTEYMDSSTRKFTLHQDDMAIAWRAPIAGITFIPVSHLDEQTVLKRFGIPAERIRVDKHVEHFLYPEKGLDLILDSKGREVLQYVSPRQFARLREPLIKIAPVTTQSP